MEISYSNVLLRVVNELKTWVSHAHCSTNIRSIWKLRNGQTDLTDRRIRPMESKKKCAQPKRTARSAQPSYSFSYIRGYRSHSQLSLHSSQISFRKSFNPRHRWSLHRLVFYFRQSQRHHFVFAPPCSCIINVNGRARPLHSQLLSYFKIHSLSYPRSTPIRRVASCDWRMGDSPVSDTHFVQHLMRQHVRHALPASKIQKM